MMGTYTSLLVMNSLLGFVTLGAAVPHNFDVGDSFKGASNVSITSDGLQRSYLLSIPPAYNGRTPVPLILSYHGGTRTAQDQLVLDQLTSPEFNPGAIVVYPQGIDDVWQGVPNVTTNDAQFTSDILDQIETRYKVDKSRIYATGKSDGGGFANVLACDATLSSRIAAYAPVSGAYYTDGLPCHPNTVRLPCNPSRADIPILAFHGGNDTTIAFNGGERKGECLPSIPNFIQQWAKRDNLNSHKPSNTSVASNTVRYSFGSSGLVGLVLDAVIGHDWPSTLPNEDNQKPGRHVASFNATPIIVEFFNQHSLSQ